MPRLFRREPKQLTLPGLPTPKAHRRAKQSFTAPGSRTGRRGPLTLLTAPVSRRTFLARALGWVTAGIAAAIAAPGVVAAVSPAFRKEASQWSPIGRLGKPGPGEPDLTVTGKPILTHFTSLVQDAYLKAQPQDVSVYVVNHGSGKFTVFDDRCTHLGCPYSWNDKSGKFDCPCHGGVFDAEGRVLGGPPPRPLDRYEYKVENGVLYAGEMYKVNAQLERTT